MPATDYAAIIETPPPPLTFRHIDEAPVRAGQTFGDCLLALEDASSWVIGHWNGKGWYDLMNGFPINPTWWALLPPVPSKLEPLSCLITAVLTNGEYDYAARLIDQLADEVRALRDSPGAVYDASPASKTDGGIPHADR